MNVRRPFVQCWQDLRLLHVDQSHSQRPAIRQSKGICKLQEICLSDTWHIQIQQMKRYVIGLIKLLQNPSCPNSLTWSQGFESRCAPVRCHSVHATDIDSIPKRLVGDQGLQPIGQRPAVQVAKIQEPMKCKAPLPQKLVDVRKKRLAPIDIVLMADTDKKSCTNPNSFRFCYLHFLFTSYPLPGQAEG